MFLSLGALSAGALSSGPRGFVGEVSLLFKLFYAKFLDSNPDVMHVIPWQPSTKFCLRISEKEEKMGMGCELEGDIFSCAIS